MTGNSGGEPPYGFEYTHEGIGTCMVHSIHSIWKDMADTHNGTCLILAQHMSVGWLHQG